ncbi:MAG: copper chaperone PCu(A)C [Chloroflexota bacterium]
MIKRSSPIFILLIGLLLVACSSGGQDGIVVQDVWGRPSPQSASNAAFYMNINNEGQAQDTLVEASIDICGATELHISTIDDAGVMSMQQVQEIDIPARETTALEPGGLHVMCIDRQVDLAPGDSVPISLSFTQAGVIVVEAEIREQ